MEVLSLNTDIVVETKGTIRLVYHLIAHDSEYDLECYLDGYTTYDRSNYCLIPHFSEDLAFAEHFTQRLAAGQVMPIHIHDVLEDYLTL